MASLEVNKVMEGHRVWLCPSVRLRARLLNQLIYCSLFIFAKMFLYLRACLTVCMAARLSACQSTSTLAGN